jgi:hypothetical protein
VGEQQQEWFEGYSSGFGPTFSAMFKEQGAQCCEGVPTGEWAAAVVDNEQICSLIVDFAFSAGTVGSRKQSMSLQRHEGKAARVCCMEEQK